jgi:hypothetical protein
MTRDHLSCSDCYHYIGDIEDNDWIHRQQEVPECVTCEYSFHTEYRIPCNFEHPPIPLEELQ